MASKKRIIIEPADERKRRQTIDHFRGLLEAKTKESLWQSFFDANPFIFSDTLSVKFDSLYRQLPLPSGRPDYVFCQQTATFGLGDYGVIELKRPTDSIIGSYSSKFIVESKALRVAVKEASSHLESLATGTFLKPDEFFVAGNRRYAFIIIGDSAEVAKKCQSDFLQKQFRTLLPPGFQLYTYDELLRLLSSTLPPIIQVLFTTQAEPQIREMSRKLRVIWPHGIHGRPSAIIASTSNRFVSDIYIAYDEESVNAKSILNLMMLAAGPGKEVVVTAKGFDAAAAISTLDELFRRQFLMSGDDFSYQNAKVRRDNMLLELGIVSQAQLADEVKAENEAALKRRKRHEMVRVAAYYQAERDGFQQDSKEYWRRAEAEIDERLRTRASGSK